MLTHPIGKTVIEQAISQIDLARFSRVIVTVLKQHVEYFQADVWIDQIFGDFGVELCVLSEETTSQSETLAATIRKMQVSGAFVSKDSDGLIGAHMDSLAGASNFVVGAYVNDFPEISNLPGKSFITLNEQGTVVDIIEKEIVSNVVSLGCYGFESAESFCEHLDELRKGWPESGEIYPSHIISSMLGQGNCFDFVRAIQYEDYGTLADFRRVQKNYKTLFVDLDGVVFENKGKYGSSCWDDGHEVLLDENIDVLKALVDAGSQIIFCTARDESCREQVENMLWKIGVKYHSLVMGLYHAQRVIINDFSNSNPWPSCVAVNIVRNSRNLRDYISGIE